VRHRPGRKTLLMACLLATLGPMCGGGLAGAQDGSSEYAVKAAFLFHFAQFVEWPDTAFRDAKSPLVYCTVGFDPFRGVLDETLKDKTVGARGFEVRHLKQAQEAHGCHLVFLGEDQKRQLASAMAALKGTPALVVGESDKFVEEGGMIGLSLEDNKVKFEVNLDATDRAGLKVSAKLLALAKHVVGGPKRAS
jgi:YfiR/HmsC-like